MDDALAHETEPLERGAPIEPRSREDLEKEPFDEQFDGDSVAARSQLSRVLRPSVFPADRYELFAEANEEGAPEAVLELLRSLPAGRQFANVHEVWAALEGYGNVRAAAARDPLSRGER
jgi:hypothetical protein